MRSHMLPLHYLFPLIDYIHIRENKDIDVGLMHCDRFASIVEFLRERQEKEDANKVIRFERKVV